MGIMMDSCWCGAPGEIVSDTHRTLLISTVGKGWSGPGTAATKSSLTVLEKGESPRKGKDQSQAPPAFTAEGTWLLSVNVSGKRNKGRKSWLKLKATIEQQLNLDCETKERA